MRAPTGTCYAQLALSLALDRQGRPNVNKTNSGKLGERQREQCKVGREQREPKSEGKTRWWTHASGCITTLTTTTATMNVVAMTNFWYSGQFYCCCCYGCCLSLLFYKFIARRKEEATKWKWKLKWRMNEWSLRGRITHTKISWKSVCILISFSCCLLIRIHCKIAGNNNNNNGKICRTLQGSKLDCPITTVCVCESIDKKVCKQMRR